MSNHLVHEYEEVLKAKVEEEREFQTYLTALHQITIELTQIKQLDYSILNEVINHIMKLPLEKGDKAKITLPDWDEKIKFNNLTALTSSRLNSGFFQMKSLDKYLSNNSNFLADSLRDKMNEIYSQKKENVVVVFNILHVIQK